MKYTQLNHRILELKDDMFQTIRDSVAIESVKSAPEVDAPYGRKNKEALDHLLSVGDALGFRTGHCDNRVGWIEYGEGDEMVGVLGHLDIVPLGDGWKFPPLACEIHDGKMYGRGVQDDKGPTIGALYALKAIKDLGLPLHRRIRILFGLDEESGSSCVEHYIASGEELPTLGFTPDAQFPAIFCEKGQAFFSVTKALTTPSDITVLSFEGGMAKNAVAADCQLVVEGDLSVSENDFIQVTKASGTTIITATGCSAHGSTPEQGENAILHLVQAVKHIRFGGDFQAVIDFIASSIALETDGTTLGLACHDAETGDTTVNLGLINYTPKCVHFTLDTRYPQSADRVALIHMLTKQLDALGFSVETDDHELLYVPKDSELIRKLMNVYAEQTGDYETPPIAIGGGTYAKSFHNMVAFGPVFPGETEVIHQPNEYANVDNLIKAVQIMGAAMYELAKQ